MGFSGLWRGALRVKAGAATRRGRAILPRNSGVFGLREGVVRRFSARRTLPDTRGEKIFKKRGEKGAENLKIGTREVPEGGMGAPYIRCVGRFLGQRVGSRKSRN